MIRTQGYDDKYGITPHPCRYSTCFYGFHQPIDVEKGDPTVTGWEVRSSLRCTKAERASTTRNLGLGLSSGFWGSESETEISKRLRVTVWPAFAANILRRPNKQTHPCASAAILRLCSVPSFPSHVEVLPTLSWLCSALVIVNGTECLGLGAGDIRPSSCTDCDGLRNQHRLTS